jgi:hypothetical protein
MPVAPDDRLETAAEHGERKQEVTQKLKKPHEIVGAALELLRDLGCQGRLRGEDLVLGTAEFGELCKAKARIKKAVLAGMREAGLAFLEGDGEVTVHGTLYPHMLPALKELAECCGRNPDGGLAAFNFAYCNFQALEPDYRPDALSLLGFFSGAEQERALRLHRFLLDAGYSPVCRSSVMHEWDIQYQGPRKIKSTPLLEIKYSERHKDPLQVYIKCASTDRLLPSFPAQPKAVRDDFRRRIYPCRGDACGWCRNRKSLGPSVLEHEGERITACWYTNHDLDRFDDGALEILQGYVLWHRELAHA